MGKKLFYYYKDMNILVEKAQWMIITLCLFPPKEEILFCFTKFPEVKLQYSRKFSEIFK